MEEHALDQKTEGHCAPMKPERSARTVGKQASMERVGVRDCAHEDRRERILFANSQRDRDRHGHERGGDGILIGERGAREAVCDSRVRSRGCTAPPASATKRMRRRAARKEHTVVSAGRTAWAGFVRVRTCRQYQNQLRAEAEPGVSTARACAWAVVRTRDSLTNARRRP